MTPTARRKRADTRDRLIDAAREVLAEEGLQGASVEVICERAGYTRGAFYSNFETRQDLVLAVFHREKELALQHLRQAVDSQRSRATDDPAIVVGHVIDDFLALQTNDRVSFLVHSEFAIHALRDPAIAEVYREAISATTDELARAVADVLALLDRRLTADLDHVVALIMGAFEYSEREALMHGGDGDRSILTGTLPQLLLGLSEAAPDGS